MNLTVNELIREADHSHNTVAVALARALSEVIDEIEVLDSGCLDNESRKSQFEYIKKLVGLPNDY